MKRIQVWSSGGGTQSAAIAALICRGELTPDICVIVDTEREVSETWDYMDRVINPNLEEAGFKLIRVPKSKYATVDLWGGKDKDKLLIPAFTDQSGKIGKMPTFCSNEWKARVVRRFVSDIMPEEKAFDLWLGMSYDELDRMKSDEGKWEYKHPLIDRKMNRQDCIELVRSMGWPPPPRSRCWMCPNQTDHDWDSLNKKDAAKAKHFEKVIQEKDPHAFLRHPSGSQGDCMSGMCFV